MVYFHRANFEEKDFTVENFFVALHVANDFLEDTWYQGTFQNLTGRFTGLKINFTLNNSFWKTIKDVIIEQHFSDVWNPDKNFQEKISSGFAAPEMIKIAHRQVWKITTITL